MSKARKISGIAGGVIILLAGLLGLIDGIRLVNIEGICSIFLLFKWMIGPLVTLLLGAACIGTVFKKQIGYGVAGISVVAIIVNIVDVLRTILAMIEISEMYSDWWIVFFEGANSVCMVVALFLLTVYTVLCVLKPQWKVLKYVWFIPPVFAVLGGIMMVFSLGNMYTFSPQIWINYGYIPYILSTVASGMMLTVGMAAYGFGISSEE